MYMYMNILNAVYCIPSTYLADSWKAVPFDYLLPVSQTPPPLPLKPFLRY